MKQLRNIGIGFLALTFSASFAQENPSSPVEQNPANEATPPTESTSPAGSAGNTNTGETVDTSKSVKPRFLTAGIRLGANYTSINGIDSAADRTINPSGGIFFNYNCGGHWGVGMDILYSPVSVEYSRTVDIDSSTKDVFSNKLTFTNISMPVYVSYSFLDPAGSLRPKLYAGLSFSGRIKANLNSKYERTASDSVVVSRESDSQGVAYDYNPADIGVIGGLGVDYWITDKMHLSFDARYTTSLFDLSDNETNAGDPIKTEKIGAFISIGYRLGKK